MYEFDGNNWNPLGQQIIGTPGDRFGESVVISGDAVSSPQSDENCSNAGKVLMLKDALTIMQGCLVYIRFYQG